MEDLPGLVFVLLFIAFSVLEGLGRKRKAQQKGGPAQKPAPRQMERPSRRAEPGAYKPQVPPSPTSRTEAQVSSDGEGSEGLIPKEIWDEILGLARGTPPSPKQTSSESPPVPSGSTREDTSLEEIPPFEARSLEPLDLEDERPTPGRERLPEVVERTASRVPSASRPQAALQASGKRAVAAAKARMPQAIRPPRTSSGPPRTRRELLGDGSPEELRKAIILKEVLGPPLALRE